METFPAASKRADGCASSWKDPCMRASRGMGDINPSKMPGAKKKARRDDADFMQFARGWFS